MRPSALAIDGGRPVRTTPFAPWPVFDSDEIEAATRVLASGRVNFWTGEECRRFEDEYAAYARRKHAIALANGTVALELALLASGIGPGDEVVVPARTFIASASCAVARGATPVVADVDPVTQNLTADTVRAVLTDRTRAIVAVHLAGWPCDMDPLMALAQERGIIVIEDCAQAHGATYKGRPVGSLGHCAAFSFCQDKILTTAGEGGMLLLDDDAAWERAWSYKDHGKSYDAVFRRSHPPGFRWVHESFGTNWRMTEVQAAVGRRQLAKLDEWVEARRRNAAALSEGLAGVDGLRLTVPGPEIRHSFYKFYAFLDVERLKPGWTQARVIEAVAAEGVPCFAGSCSEIYREQAFVRAGLGPRAPLPNARALGETSLMLLVHPTLHERDMRDASTAVRKVLAEAVMS